MYLTSPTESSSWSAFQQILRFGKGVRWSKQSGSAELHFLPVDQKIAPYLLRKDQWEALPTLSAGAMDDPAELHSFISSVLTQRRLRVEQLSVAYYLVDGISQDLEQPLVAGKELGDAQRNYLLATNPKMVLVEDPKTSAEERRWVHTSLFKSGSQQPIALRAERIRWKCLQETLSSLSTTGHYNLQVIPAPLGLGLTLERTAQTQRFALVHWVGHVFLFLYSEQGRLIAQERSPAPEVFAPQALKKLEDMAAQFDHALPLDCYSSSPEFIESVRKQAAGKPDLINEVRAITTDPRGLAGFPGSMLLQSLGAQPPLPSFFRFDCEFVYSRPSQSEIGKARWILRASIALILIISLSACWWAYRVSTHYRSPIWNVSAVDLDTLKASEAKLKDEVSVFGTCQSLLRPRSQGAWLLETLNASIPPGGSVTLTVVEYTCTPKKLAGTPAGTKALALDYSLKVTGRATAEGLLTIQRLANADLWIPQLQVAAQRRTDSLLLPNMVGDKVLRVTLEAPGTSPNPTQTTFTLNLAWSQDSETAPLLTP